MEDVVTPGPPSPQVFTGRCGHRETSLTTPGAGPSLSQPWSDSLLCGLPQWQQAQGWQGRHGFAAGLEAVAFYAFQNLPGDRTLFPSLDKKSPVCSQLLPLIR